MTKKIIVRPEDLKNKLEQLMIAAQEGRLILEQPAIETDKEVVKEKVRAYVERIRGKVCRKFSSTIDQIWNDIFADDELMGLLMPNNKTRKCKDFNKNGVFRILGVLINHDVYELLNHRNYGYILEETTEDTSYRSFLSRGIDSHSALTSLRRIVRQYAI